MSVSSVRVQNLKSVLNKVDSDKNETQLKAPSEARSNNPLCSGRNEDLGGAAKVTSRH
ncbi:hypothetical protein OsccyDRAFT_3503 [Leptolyngbyaceae cyanobacterium JSC-12]|nr:hypothetical protein OsccyDRAFT_3503 [Leptolyngbyaceae cyanobacterium JSC-12]